MVGLVDLTLQCLLLFFSMSLGVLKKSERETREIKVRDKSEQAMWEATKLMSSMSQCVYIHMWGARYR